MSKCKRSREKIYPAPYYPGLGVTRSGRVFRQAREKWVEVEFEQPNSDYLRIRHLGKPVMVHHVCLTTFKGPRPAGKLALHKDDCRHNNSRTNLYWGTRADNRRDAARNKGGRNKPGDEPSTEKARRAAKGGAKNAKADGRKPKRTKG